MTSKVLAHIEVLGMSVNWEKSLLHPTQQASFIGLSLDLVSMRACPTGGADSGPATVFPPWGEFDRPDVTQAAWDVGSGLSNHTTGAAASTPSAEVVQQPPHGPSLTQGYRSRSLSRLVHLCWWWDSTFLLLGVPQLSPSEARGGNHGRLTSWLGGGMAEKAGPWSLVPSVKEREAQVDLFASERTTHCPLWSSLMEASARLVVDSLVNTWPRGLRSTQAVGRRPPVQVG